MNPCNRALTQLARLQSEAGNFTSYSSPTYDDFLPKKHYQTVFPNALILCALRNVADEQGTSIKQRLAAYLLTQKSSLWSFNYWDRGSQESQSLPYPDDLDDTFCALSALYHQSSEVFTGEVLAAATVLLTATEVVPGGPYRTWLTTGTAPQIWQDVDIAVNANIAYFLSLQGIRLEPLDAFIRQAIAASQLVSPYYPQPYPLFYFLARGAGPSEKKKLLLLIKHRQHPQGHWGTALATALAVSALYQCGYDMTQLIPARDFLLAEQQSDGLWPAASFCFDPAQKGKPYYAGSAALTTALCLEALTVLQIIPPGISGVRKQPNRGQGLKATVLREAARTLGPLAPSQTVMDGFLSRLVRHRRWREIIILPYMFAPATIKRRNRSMLTQLCLAHFYGWVAYTLYDDVWDADRSADWLPPANAALRQCLQELLTIFPVDYHPIAQETLQKVDVVHAQELRQRSIGLSWSADVIQGGGLSSPIARADMAYKSYGHMLGVIGVLSLQGIPANSYEIEACKQFFHHYLSAAQLHDDAHDWLLDVRRGDLTPVVAELTKSQAFSGAEKLVEGSVLELTQYFYTAVLPKVCQQVLQELTEAEVWLEKLHSGLDTNFGRELLSYLRASAQMALEEHKKAQSFIDYYSR